MKKTFSLLLACGIFSATAALAQGSLSDSLLAYYPFTNGSMQDASGNNRVLINMGATVTQGASGVDSSAYYFDGNSSYMVMSANAGINFMGDFTICMKVKPMGFYMGACHASELFAKGTDYNDSNALSILFDDGLYTGGMNCSNPVPDTLHQTFHFDKLHLGNGYTTNTVSTPPYATYGQWSALVMEQKGDTMYQYIDGTLISAVYGPSYTGTNTYDLVFGKSGLVTNIFHFKGVMDEIRFYNRALADTEVKYYTVYRPAGEVPLSVKGKEDGTVSIMLSPNPAVEVLNLTNPSAKNLSFRVLDLLGKEMITGVAASGDNKIPVSQLANGMYLLQVQEGKAVMQTLRFVKQ